LKTCWTLLLEARELLVWTAAGEKPERLTDQVSWRPVVVGEELRVDLRALFDALPEYQDK
jgi:hypothetical protein